MEESYEDRKDRIYGPIKTPINLKEIASMRD